jgi:hypothetical protein
MDTFVRRSLQLLITINHIFMAFIIRKGKTKFIYLPVTTSTAITAGTIVTASSGLLVAATSGTTTPNHIGVLRHTIASTDSDYATARSVEVEVPVDRYCEWEADVTSGLVAADIMNEVDLTDGANVNRGASSIKVARCTKVLTTTKGWFQMKFGGAY